MQKMQQFYVLKFDSGRLAKSNYKIDISMREARSNGELIALGDSNVLRSIRKIRGRSVDFDYINNLFKERRKITRRRKTKANKSKIHEIDKDLDNLLFIPEYVSVVMEKDSHYRALVKKKLWVNGEPYVRCLCGAGNARRNTVFFIKESMHDELDRILKNGCKDIPIVENKYNAYYALAASATYTVSEPRVCIVRDCEINMTKVVDWVDRSEYIDKISEKEMELGFNLFDGMGICSPELAKTWAKDLDLDYVPCEFIVRNAFLKGMLCTFDFHKFAKEIAHKDTIVDYFGNEYNINDIDVIITESMFKLVKAYDSWEHYISCLKESGFEWGVTKFNPKRDKTAVFTNYQFLQVLNLDTKEKIKELCKPTISWLNKVIHGDYNSTLIYLLGALTGSDKDDLDDFDLFNSLDDYMIKALILNPEVLKDPYIKSKIYRSLNRKINEAYIGKLLVDGNFQIMISDPYALCEHAFGLEVKGLLMDNEHYSNYWTSRGVNTVIGDRAPLTHTSETNVLHFIDNEYTKEWYKYLYSGIVYNVWGNDCMKNADSDFDGDILFTTNNKVMVDNVIDGNPITYQKKPVEKRLVNNSLLYKADMKSFNSKIGYITNCSTTLYSMLPLYEEGSREYKEIMTRLKLCRVLQGDTIDSAKGLVTKQFPSHWINWTNPDKENDNFSEDEIRFNNSLLIEKRPYFMKYLYSTYKNNFKKHYEQYDFFSQMNYGISLDELKSKSYLTADEKQLLDNYQRYSPFIDSNCTMNNICHYMEKEISELKINTRKKPEEDFWKMLYNDSIEITEQEINQMLRVYKAYRKSLSSKEPIIIDDFDDKVVIDTSKHIEPYQLSYISDDLCKLANLAVYVNYFMFPGSVKDFCWNIFGNGILLNLYCNSDKNFYIPIEDKFGDIEYMGKRYRKFRLEVDMDDNI